MTKVKLIDIARIKTRNLKKFTSNPEEAFNYSTKKFFSSESKKEVKRKELVDEIGKFEEPSEKVRLTSSRYADVKKTADTLGIEDDAFFGKGSLTKVDPGKEAVEKYATGIEHKYQNEKFLKLRSTFKNIMLGNKKKYIAPPPKVSLHPHDPVRKDQTLSKLVLNIRKESQPKYVLTSAGQEKLRQLKRAEGTALKVAAQRAQIFRETAAESGLPIERVKDLKKEFVKSKMIKQPVSSEVAIASGFPGKGSGYDPAGLSIIDDFTAEWGYSVHPRAGHPFQKWQTKEIAKWNKEPIVGRFKSYGGTSLINKPASEETIILRKGKLHLETKHSPYVSDQSNVGKQWTKSLGKPVVGKSLKIPKKTKSDIGYSKIKEDWKKANQRIEKEFLKGFERKKGPFNW